MTARVEREPRLTHGVPGEGLRYASSPARRQRIVDLVHEASYLAAGELSQALDVSEMTIRRDIRLLESQGLVRAVHGGVSRVPDLSTGTDFRLRLLSQHEAKVRIAQEALGFVSPDTTIALDNGTTTLELARLLIGTRLSVVTPSLAAMVILCDRPEIEVVGLGGVLHVESQGFAGPATTAALSSIRVEKLFLAASAIGHGAMWCGNAWDAQTKRELIGIADDVILLADSSKFRGTALTLVAPISAVHTLITDSGIAPETRKEFEDAGARVLVVTADQTPSMRLEPTRL
jgi:DeoR/GlpR family transcriptional regulator of sugar metabolism